MAKIRVGQLAKELNLKAAEVLSRLRELGAEVKTNLSTVDEEVAARLKAAVAGPVKKPAEAAGKPAIRPSASVGKTVAATQAAKPAAATPASGPAVPVATTKPAAFRPAPAPTSSASMTSAHQVIKPVGTAPARPATPSPGRVASVPSTRPATSPASPTGHATPPHAGGPTRPGVPSPNRPMVPAGTIRPSVGTPVTRPLAPKAPGIPSTVRPPGVVPPATRLVQRSPLPAGQKLSPAPPRPLVAGAAQPRVTRPMPPGSRPMQSPAKPSSARPGAVASTLRSVPRSEPAKLPPPISQAGRTQPSPAPRPVAPPAPAVPETLQEISITEGVTVKELSEKMDRKAKDIITRLIGRGILATINQPLDITIAKEICREFGFDAKVITFEEEVTLEHTKESDKALLRARDPVVTIMGHVDHGKTSLLDAIRESNIAASEAGGITQHIGAYHIRTRNRGITFIDTPGHEAFTMMRARGARVTDIVILVVAADDGVMPQTVEAIHHARAAGVPMVVAINKMDKPGANLDRVKKQLSDQGLLVEDWGGDVVAVPISAKQKKGIDELLEMILLVADIGDLKADASSLASGVVLDAKLDRSRGPVATVLVQRGTLRIGDPFIAGAVHGKVRAMFDDLGHRVRESGPSIPVEVLGLEGVPEAGNPFQVLEDEWKVRQIGAFRQQKLRQEAMAKSSRLTLDHLYEQIKEGTVKELPLVVKADVQGSVEALSKSINDLPSDKVKIKIIHSGSGAITETDVHLASASNAIIIGYNVRPERSAQDLAEKEKVDIRLHSVIYDITSEIKNAMLGLLEPESKEVYLGRAEVRQVFKVPKVGTVAGSYVSDGRVARSAEVRLLRDNVVVYTGKVASLRRFKDDASEVKAGYECGIGLANYNDIKTGDVIEAFRVEKIAVKNL